MKPGNEIFNSLNEHDLENGPLGLLMGMNATRLAYLQQVLETEFATSLRGCKILDVGCGIGLLSEPLARLGCEVTAIDSSSPSLALARQRARQAGLEIAYHHANAENLPFADERFDAVLCCDVLEHTSDLERIILEAARVLRVDGFYLYGTINRTLASWLLAIKLLQDWSFSALLPKGLHHWQMFIKPHELVSLMASRGLKQIELVGLSPSASPLKIIENLCRYKRNQISAHQFGQRLALKTCRQTHTQYLGYARKRRTRDEKK